MSSSKETTKLKRFIQRFNYPEPNWDDLPSDFPNCDTKNLSPHEEGLYSGIVLVWYADYGGRPALLKRFTQSLLLLVTMVASGLIIKNILTSNMFGRAITVNAATVSGTLRTISANNQNNENLLNSSFKLEGTTSGFLKNTEREK